MRRNLPARKAPVPPQPKAPARRIVCVSLQLNTHYYPGEIGEVLQKAFEQASIEVLKLKSSFKVIRGT